MPDQLRDDLQRSLGASYVLERELGGGGMSRVFVAEDARLRRKVVVKVLKPELAAGISAERSEREIQLAAALQHPHIVPVHAAGEAGGLPYYTMPFVDGASLRARMSEGPVPRTEAVSVLRDVAKALAYAHRNGVVHRDIKPENVLIAADTAVVSDFGIAKALSASKTAAPGATLTSIGMSLGTPAYMAPEQAAGDDVDHRADLYSWGIVAYELLAGAHPFAGKTSAKALITAHIAELPAPLAERAPTVPAESASWGAATFDVLQRATRLGWRYRDRLSEQDRALLLIQTGPRYPAPRSGADYIAAVQRYAALAPDAPKASYFLGEAYFHYGPATGVEEAAGRARQAFERATELDSTFVPALEHLPELYVILGDTAGLRRSPCCHSERTRGISVHGETEVCRCAQVSSRDHGDSSSRRFASLSRNDNA